MNPCRALKLLLTAKKEWSLPRKSDILIYDRNGSDVLRQYVSAKDSVILHTRGESINIPVLLLSRFRIKAYIDRYIQFVTPKFVVTQTDNNLAFYSLKSRYPNAIFITIQNGVRSRRGDMFSTIQNHKEKLQVDYMCTFNQPIGREYLKYISGKVESIGSLKNNLHPIRSTQANKDVLFVSQYTSPPGVGLDGHFQFVNGVSVSWRNVYEAEKKVLELLIPYCHRRNLRLSIVGRLAQSESEHKFYKDLIPDYENWEFLPKCNKSNSYSLVDQSQYIVGIDSTLLCEAFSRGKKVAFFSWRGDILSDDSCRFAWPSVLEDSGPFWSNKVDKDEIDRVMSYIMNTSPNEWKEIYSQYCQNIMDYDPANTRIISLFRELGLPMSEKHV